MKKIKRIMLAVLTIILSVSLTVQVEAKVKKSTTPTVRVVNGTVIINVPKVKKNQVIHYNLYKKKNGKWERENDFWERHDGTRVQYVEALHDGTYAITTKINNMPESNKKTFKVTKSINRKGNIFEYEPDFPGSVYESYKVRVNFDKTKSKKLYLTTSGFEYHPSSEIPKMSISAYYVDSKGKLKFIGKKKLSEYKDYGLTEYEVSFPTVKGQLNYAFAQVNSKGKVLGYLHLSYESNGKKANSSHFGQPIKSMKYKKSDWE